MSKFIDVSDQRLDGYLERLLDELDLSYEAMISKHAAEGVLKSGGTIKRTMELVSVGADKLKSFLIEQAAWVIDKSVYVPVSIGNELIDMSEKHFESYIEQSAQYLQQAAKVAGKPELFERLFPDVEAYTRRCLKEANLEVMALVLENRSSGIKGIAKYIFSMAYKLWGG